MTSNLLRPSAMRLAIYAFVTVSVRKRTKAMTQRAPVQLAHPHSCHADASRALYCAPRVFSSPSLTMARTAAEQSIPILK